MNNQRNVSAATGAACLLGGRLGGSGCTPAPPGKGRGPGRGWRAPAPLQGLPAFRVCGAGSPLPHPAGRRAGRGGEATHRGAGRRVHNCGAATRTQPSSPPPPAALRHLLPRTTQPGCLGSNPVTHSAAPTFWAGDFTPPGPSVLVAASHPVKGLGEDCRSGSM